MDLIFVTDKNMFFGQTRKPWVSLKTDELASHLKNFGINPIHTEFWKIANSSELLTNSTIFYHFSQKENLRHYLKDVAEHLNSLGNRLIPGIELLRCHENKGYQELLKKQRGIADIKAHYFSSIDELEILNPKYPLVVKTIDGSNGKGVFLCQNFDDAINKLSKFTKLGLIDKIDLFRRRYLRKEKTFKEYPEYSNYSDYLLYRDYITPQLRFVAQEFIPNQTYDFRVLALHDKFFVMKRYTNENDFRASGTKKFEFEFDLDTNLLDTAYSIKDKFHDSPFLSMDFVYDSRDKTYKLIEFQALHFGVSAVLKNKFYFKKAATWEKHNKTGSVEYELAEALSKYLTELT